MSEEIVLAGERARPTKGFRRCVAYKTVVSRRLGKPVRRCARFAPLR